jgi:RNA ligase
MVQLRDILDVPVLEQLIKDGFISRKFHNEYKNLAVLNYTPAATYDPNLVWNTEMNLSRGLVYCLDGMEVVARAFSKFWNLGDTRHPETLMENLPNEIPLFLEKLDGSLGVMFSWDGLNHVATRGSFHSEQAEWATNWLRRFHPRLQLPKTHTLLSEIIYKENKIVVDYDFEGLVVLGAVNMETGKESPRADLKPYCVTMGLPLVKEYKTSLEKTLREDENNREGYVLHYPSTGLKVKVKFETYKTLHSLLTQMNPRSIWELLRDGQGDTINGWLADPIMPETFKKWVSDTANGLNKQFSDIHMKVLDIFESKPNLDPFMPYKESRKAMAAYFTKEEFRQYSGLLFACLDSKSINHMIWKMIEPSGSTTFIVEGE